jgi:ATP-dependent helicase/nuclease subunit A
MQRPWYYLLGELAPTLDPAAPLRRAWDKLQAWKARADRMPVHDLLDHIYCDGGVPACYLAVFPSHLHPRVQSNLMRFLELALEIESGRYPSIPRFVASLRELHRYAQEALEEPPSQPGLAGVRLMTIHAAKGLEAPVVFLLDAARSPTVTRAFQAVVSWPSETARPQHFLLGGRRQEHDDVSAALLDRLAADEAREEANLLYVALTRACQFLYISGCRPKKSGEKLGWYGQLASGLGEEPSRIAAEGWVLADAELPRCAPATGEVAAIQAGTAPDPRLARPLAITLEAGEVTPSMADSTLMPDTGEDRVETGPGSEEERQRGKAIHRMLDLLTSPGAAPAPAALAGEFGLDPLAPELQEWWREARAVVALTELRDCFDPTRYRRAYNEIPVYHAQDGLVVHGVIDRLVMHPSGLTLIDYKTRRAAGSDPLERIAVRYRAQLRLYRNAVRRLWPEPPLRVLLVFTASARVFECTEEFLGGHGGA